VQLFFNDKGFDFNEPSYFTAVSTTGQFFLMIAFSALFTATTRPLDIIKILNLILKPLKILKVDTQNIAASGIIALRFIPLLFEEADKIKTAQILRNDTTKRGIKRLLDIEAFIIPLFLRVMYFSEQIAITLQFRGNWETICKLSKTKFSEILITLLYILILAGIYCV
jgi:energy-coupling factor transport system permease protein